MIILFSFLGGAGELFLKSSPASFSVHPASAGFSYAEDVARAVSENCVHLSRVLRNVLERNERLNRARESAAVYSANALLSSEELLRQAERE